jgi:hypothetical protein
MTESIYNRADSIVNRAYDMFPIKHQESQYVENPFPMCSFERAATEFWFAFTVCLINKGLTDSEIEWLLRSKHMRWMFDAEVDFHSLVEKLITDNMIEQAKKEGGQDA